MSVLLVSTPLNKVDKRVASSPLESDDSDLKKQRHISGGSHTYLLEEGETTGDHSPVHLLSQPMAPTDIISIAAELRSLMLPEMVASIDTHQESAS